jgi:hypothetical protein
VRKLLVQKFQQESETVDKLKTVSPDFRFAQADAYYHQQQQEMIRESWNYKPEAEWDANPEEEMKPKCKKTENGKKWDYLVTEREMNHIEKHIHRAERARGLRDHKYRLIPQNLSCEMLSPKPEDEKKKTIPIPRPHKTVPKKPKMAWAKEQMKQHKDRMMRARVLTEQRQDQRKTPKFTSHGHPHLKSKAKKEEKKEFEKVKAYPIFQPSKEKLIEVMVLMEKSKSENVQKPLQRGILCMPPFLKSQLEKNKKLKLCP